MNTNDIIICFQTHPPQFREMLCEYGTKMIILSFVLLAKDRRKFEWVRLQ